MAQEGHQDSPDESENYVMAPLFFRKQPLNKEEKIEMDEEMESMKSTVCDVKVMWKSLTAFFSQKEASIMRRDRHTHEAKQTRTDSLTLTPVKTRSQAAAQPDTTIYSGLDEDAIRSCYERWSNDLKETLRKQKRKTRNGVEKWFEYLHRFDCVQPKPSRYKAPSFNFIYCGLVTVFCASYAILSSGPEDTNVCDGEPLACFHEKILEFLYGVYNFYVAFHNITIDSTEAAGIAFDSNK